MCEQVDNSKLILCRQKQVKGVEIKDFYVQKVLYNKQPFHIPHSLGGLKKKEEILQKKDWI